MKIKTKKGRKDYYFQPEDICCISGNPKNNFKKHVKCCVLDTDKTIYPPNCNDLCLG